MSRIGAALSALVVAALVILGCPRTAAAWVEVHVEADDIRVSIERNGDARIEHRITLKIAGSPLRTFDLRGVDADAVPDPDGYVVPQREAAKGSLASAQAVAAERLPPDIRPRADGSPAPPVLRVRFDPDRGLARGVYVLLVRYSTHLAGRIVADGPLARVSWRGPVLDDGFDSARVTFELPAAPTAPRADDANPDAASDPGRRAPTVLSTVRRGTAKDHIELLRPYAPKGDAITWAIRADARAFQTGPAAPPPPPSGIRAKLDDLLGEPGQRALLGLGALSLFLLYASLVALKAGEVARLCRAAGVSPRPFVPLPAALRAVVAGLALVAGVFIQLALARATFGALLVLAAVALAAHRAPHAGRPRLRGPGRWLPIAESAAFRDPPRPRAFLDASTRAGKLFLLLAISAVLAAAALLHDTSPFRAVLVAFDSVALLAIFGTGRIAEIPPDPATAPAPLLRDVARRIRKAIPGARIVGRIRVPEGSAEPDELRLAVAPPTAPPGFGAIEIGVLYAIGAGTVIALPEVILRVAPGSVCDHSLAELSRHGRSTRGRKSGERAFLFTPKLPTARMTAGIAVRLLRAISAAKPSKRAPERAPIRRAA